MKPRAKVLFVALGSTLAGSGLEDVEYVIAHGGEVVVIGVSVDAEDLDPRIAVIPLRDRLSRSPAMRSVDLLLGRLPRRGLSAGRRAMRMLSTIRGCSRFARTGLGSIRRADGFRRALHRRTTRAVQPYVLRRIAKRDVLASLDVGDFDHVVAKDQKSVPLVWRLARQYPDLSVTVGFPREAWATRQAGGMQREETAK